MPAINNCTCIPVSRFVCKYCGLWRLRDRTNFDTTNKTVQKERLAGHQTAPCLGPLKSNQTLTCGFTALYNCVWVFFRSKLFVLFRANFQTSSSMDVRSFRWNGVSFKVNSKALFILQRMVEFKKREGMLTFITFNTNLLTLHTHKHTAKEKPTKYFITSLVIISLRD